MTQPRVIRHQQAAKYLGMDIRRFNNEVRPSLIEIPIGVIGIGYDRFDLDSWFDDYKARVGRPGKQPGEQKCQRKHQVYLKGVKSGTSTKGFAASEFEKAVKQAKSRKRKDI